MILYVMLILLKILSVKVQYTIMSSVLYRLQGKLSHWLLISLKFFSFRKKMQSKKLKVSVLCILKLVAIEILVPDTLDRDWRI